jgi:uncharacterized protein
MKRIDFHIHCMPNTGPQEGPMPEAKIRTATPVELKDEIYPALGVDKGVLLPVNPFGSDGSLDEAYEAINEAAFALTREYPDLFYWFCNLDPRMGENSTDTDFSVYLNKYKEMGAKGVGEIFSNLYFDDPFVDNMLSHCEKCSMPVLFHMTPAQGQFYGLADDIGLPRLEKMLAKYPDLIFFGHSQPFWAEISSDLSEDQRNDLPQGKITSGRVTNLMRSYANLHADLSAFSGFNALSRDPEFAYSFIDEFQDRLLYGTDLLMPMRNIPLAEFLDKAVEEDLISKSAYGKVCRENALKILED